MKYARQWVESVHRRIPVLTGAMWCVGLWDGPDMRGLAVVGRPSARMLDVAARERIGTVEVIRVAVIEGTPNGCSMLYGACARAGRSMGLDAMLTYIHDDETGVSLRAAGWVKDRSTDGGEWSRPSRQRALALDSKPKTRWWAAWSDVAKERDVVTERQPRPRRVECLCAPSGWSDVRDGRWVHSVTHSLLCPVTAEHGTTDEEFDEGPVGDNG